VISELPPDTPLPLLPAESVLYSEPQPCPNCAGEKKTFVPLYLIVDVGWWGYCEGCGDEKLVRFERTNSEAA
jgi:hypothetical protein